MSVRFGPFRLDAARGELWRGGERVPLQPQSLALLALLTTEPGRIWSREELHRALWGELRVGEDALTQAVRRVRRALDDDPEQPRWIEAVPRRGWRFLGVVEARRPAGEGFVGREPELEQLDDLLRAERAAVLHGPGGVGKTRLAEEWLRAGAHPHVRVALGEAEDADVLRLCAQAVGVPQEGAGVAPRLVHALRRRPGLVLFLDEADGVPAAVAELAAAVRAETEVRLLLTSRVAVPGLPALPLGPLPRADARSLLVGLAARGGPGSVPAEASLDGLLDLADDLPLAIELLAGRLRVAEAGQLTRLAPLDVLRDGGGRSLRGVLEASWGLLGPAEREVVEACAVLPQPLEPKDVDEVLGLPGGASLDALARLLDMSLLQRGPQGLGMLETVRAYGRERLGERGRWAGTVEAWAKVLAARAAPLLAGFWRWELPAVTGLAALAEPLLSAWRALPPASPLRPRLAEAAAAARRYGGPWTLGRELLEQAVPPGQARPEAPSAAVMLAEYRVRTGDVGGGLALLDGLLAEGAPTAEPAVRSQAHFLRARVYCGGDAARALVEGEQALEAARAARSEGAVALAWDVLGLTHALRGELGPTHAAYRAAREACRAPDLAWLRGIVTQNYAAALGRLGQHDEAVPWFAAALDELRLAPSPHLVATAAGNLGGAWLHADRVEEAVPLLEEALRRASAIGDAYAEHFMSSHLGLCHLRRGRLPEARRALELAEAVAAAPADRVAARRRLALLAWAEGRLDLAEALIQTALDLDAPGPAHTEARHVGAGIARRRGDLALAAAREEGATPVSLPELRVLRGLEGEGAPPAAGGPGAAA